MHTAVHHCETTTTAQHYTNMWLGSATVKCWTYDGTIVGSTPGEVAIKCLLLGWVIVCVQVNHLSI